MKFSTLVSVSLLAFSDAFLYNPSIISRSKFNVKQIQHVNYRIKTRSSMVIDPEVVKSALIHAAPWVIGYGITMSVLNNLPETANMMNFPGSGNDVGTISTDTSISMDDVAGIDHIKTEIEEIISFMKNPEKYHDIGSVMIKGILLHGSPGVGKSLLARAIAGESNCPLLYANGAEFVNMFIGKGASNIRKLFEKARGNSPCVIFIDEIDSLCGKRGMGIGGNDERDSTLNQFLSEMDGMNRDNDNILVIGATNRLDLLDSAAIRPGRFDRKLSINLPNKTERLQVLNLHARKKKLDDDVNLEKIAKLTPGMSPATLASILNEASILAVRNERTRVSQVDLEEALEKSIVGIRLPNRFVSEKTERLVAVHECGHAVAGIIAGKTVSRVSCIPSSSGTGGYTMFVNEEDTENDMPTRNELVEEIKTLQGGRAAEQIFYGKDNVTTGASSDLERVKSLASFIIDDMGMGDQSVYVSSQTEATVVSLINQCYDEIVYSLSQNVSLLGELTEGLLEKRELRQQEFYEIYDKFIVDGGSLKK